MRSARKNVPELPLVTLSVTGMLAAGIEDDNYDDLFAHFRYVTVDGRTDNCLLSSVSTPVSNVGSKVQ